MAQKSTELEQYLQRVQELEDMYGRLQDALEDERRARQDEEAVRRLQARSVTRAIVLPYDATVMAASCVLYLKHTKKTLLIL